MQKEHFSHCQCVTAMRKGINQIKPGNINFHAAVEMNNTNLQQMFTYFINKG